MGRRLGEARSQPLRGAISRISVPISSPCESIAVKMEVLDSMMLGITTAIAATRIGSPRLAPSRNRSQTNSAAAATKIPIHPRFAKPSANRLAFA